jgi:hypothetical protein
MVPRFFISSQRQPWYRVRSGDRLYGTKLLPMSPKSIPGCLSPERHQAVIAKFVSVIVSEADDDACVPDVEVYVEAA